MRNIFICHTYYHVLVACAKALQNGEKNDILLTASWHYSDLSNDKELRKRLRASGIFRKVIEDSYGTGEKAAKYDKGRLISIRRLWFHRKMLREYPMDFKEYDEIYTFSDGTPVGVLLNDLKIEHVLLEDGVDCFKNNQIAVRSNGVRRKLKLLFGLKEAGDSEYLKYVEVNDKDGVFLENQKLVEVPRKELFESLSKAEKAKIFKVFLGDAKLSEYKNYSLLITQPLFVDAWVESPEEQIAIYDEIVEKCLKGEKVLIKTHPREGKIDYAKLTQKCTVIKANFPLELFDFCDVKFRKVVTISSTAVNALSCEERIYLGWGYLEEFKRGSAKKGSSAKGSAAKGAGEKPAAGKASTEKAAFKAGVWYTACGFLIRGLAFITMPIFTRVMSTYDIGIFSNIIAWFSILAIVTTFELHASVNIARFDFKKELDSYISSLLVLGSLITGGFYILALISHEFVESFLSIDFVTLNIIFVYLLVYPSVQMFQVKHRIKYEYKSIIFVSLLSAILSTVVALALVLLSDDKLMGRVYGYFMPLIVISAVIYVNLLLAGKKVSRKYWGYALAISFPMIWHLLATYLLSAADRVMITKMVSPEANALYSVSYALSSIATLLWGSMNNAWSPWAYEKMDEKNYGELKSKSKPYTIFFVVVVFAMMLLAPELLLLMGGSGYVEAKYVIPPVMAGIVFQFVYSLYVNIEFYHKKQKVIARNTITACLINIALNALLIPAFGYVAAAYTTLIGYMCLFALHFLTVRKLGCTSWYDTKFFMKIFMAAIGLMAFANLLYAYDVLRYIVIGAIFAILVALFIKHRKKIMRAIKDRSFIELASVFKGEKVVGK